MDEDPVNFSHRVHHPSKIIPVTHPRGTIGEITNNGTKKSLHVSARICIYILCIFSNAVYIPNHSTARVSLRTPTQTETRAKAHRRWAPPARKFEWCVDLTLTQVLLQTKMRCSTPLATGNDGDHNDDVSDEECGGQSSEQQERGHKQRR